MPTIYEAIGIKPPEHVEGTAQIPIDGVSMMYTWNNASAAGRKDTQYFEVMGSRGSPVYLALESPGLRSTRRA